VAAVRVKVGIEHGDLGAGGPGRQGGQQAGQLRRIQPARCRAVDRRHDCRIEDVHVEVQPVPVEQAGVHGGQDRLRDGGRSGLADPAGRDHLGDHVAGLR
jgi:hypothetical protein